MEKSRRRRYLVSRPMQFRYLGLVGVPLIVLLTALYYLIYYAVLNEILIPEAIALTLLPAMRKVNLVIAILAPILLYIILRTALIHSNRIIGPVPRLERELDKAIAAGHSLRITTRKNDELRCFVNKVNCLLEKLDKNQK